MHPKVAVTICLNPFLRIAEASEHDGVLDNASCHTPSDVAKQGCKLRVGQFRRVRLPEHAADQKSLVA